MLWMRTCPYTAPHVWVPWGDYRKYLTRFTPTRERSLDIRTWITPVQDRLREVVQVYGFSAINIIEW